METCDQISSHTAKRGKEQAIIVRQRPEVRLKSQHLFPTKMGLMNSIMFDISDVNKSPFACALEERSP